MDLVYRNLDDGIRLIQLNGVLDMNGTYSIEVDFFRHCEGGNPRVLVDLSNMSYISSIGIPMLVNAAKSVTGRGGKLVLLNPQSAVMYVLELAAIPLIIPIYFDLEAAKAGLLAAQ